MHDERPGAGGVEGIEGADAGALGTAPPPESAPEAAEVDGEETRVPGATFGSRPATEAKPWFTSLAAESEQAGVGNDPVDAQETEYRHADDEAV